MSMCNSHVKTLILLLCVATGASGQTFKQTAWNFQTTTATTIAVTFPGVSTTGNLIVVHLDWDKQTVSVSSVTDNKGNTYTRINGPTNWNGTLYRAELWYAHNITGGAGAITVTGHLSGAPTGFSQIYINEYSGIVTSNPLDQNAVAIGNTGAVSSGAKTTSYTNELIYGASIGATGTLSTGALFTNRSSANSNIIEDRNVAPIGSYNAGFTSASGNWIAQMATFISTTSNTLLPLELVSFKGECRNKKIDLDWTVASETNNNYYTIQHSADAIHWTDISTVTTEPHSDGNKSYHFTVDPTAEEISYFRLKQTDYDGNFSYMKTITVNPCESQANVLEIFPNPSNGISLSGKIHLKNNIPYSLQVLDNTGKMVLGATFVQPGFNIRFTHRLNPGIYYLQASAPGFATTSSFLVQ